MHAGVINDGGFLVIRLSPLVSLSPIALELLALIGALTAIMGSVVMLTQTSIKRSLAYSTMAQMGFMMLQCGLGAFSAALLHIVAHSAYKAHAFLSCGSILDNVARMKVPALPAALAGWRALALVAALTLAPAILFVTVRGVGIDLLAKPGGLVLGLILTLALAQLLWNGLSTGVLRLALRSVALALLVAGAYSVAYLAMDHLVASSTSHHTTARSALDLVILAIVALGFVGIFVLQAVSGPLAGQRWVRALYVHAMNGFYIDIPARRLTARIYGVTGPVQ
jgi:NAD(P)H-quinone oxidoreductase subunit 5